MPDSSQIQSDWNAWVETLSPSERANLEQLGLGDPLDEPTSTAARSRDAADLPAAQLLPTQGPEPTNDEAGRLAFAIRSALQTIENARDPRYAVAIVGLAIGDTTISRRELAKERGATKQAISKAVRKVQKKLGLECIGTAASRAALDAAKARAHTAAHAREVRLARLAGSIVKRTIKLPRKQRKDIIDRLGPIAISAPRFEPVTIAGITYRPHSTGWIATSPNHKPIHTERQTLPAAIEYVRFTLKAFDKTAGSKSKA